jgi:hypothetical protein
MEGVNLINIHCKHNCKCHNGNPPVQYLLKKQKQKPCPVNILGHHNFICWLSISTTRNVIYFMKCENGAFKNVQ